MERNSKTLTTLFDLPLNHNSNSEPNTDSSTSKQYKIIDNSFICHKKLVIGSGSFGKVLYGTNMEKTKEFAIKFEKSTVKHSVIKEEMKILQDLSGGEGIPNIYYFGNLEDYKILVMDLLGPSLDKFFKISNKKLTLETTVNFGIQMINRIEYVHSKNYLHRDIKPNNFLLGKFDKNFDNVDNTVYIIDFGLSKPYVDPLTNKHYEYRDNSRFVGTPRYASLNTHLGIRQSRRDDLEAIAYVLIYFLLGELPWQGIKAKTKSEKKEKIKNKKKRMSTNKLCEGLPVEFLYLVDYTKNLKFEEKPNYEYIKRLLSRVKFEYNINMNIHSSSYLWEWEHTCLESQINVSQINYMQVNKTKRNYEKLYEGYPVCSYEEYSIKLKKRNETAHNVNESHEECLEEGIMDADSEMLPDKKSEGSSIFKIYVNDTNSFVVNAGVTPISSPFQSNKQNDNGNIKVFDEFRLNYSISKVKGVSSELK